LLLLEKSLVFSCFCCFIYLNDNIDNVWEQWSTKYKEVLDQHVPVKKKWIRGDQLPWINPEILREISLRNKLFKHHKQNACEQSWLAFKIQRNKVTSLKRQGVKDFCSNASLTSKNPGEFWKKNEASLAKFKTRS